MLTRTICLKQYSRSNSLSPHSFKHNPRRLFHSVPRPEPLAFPPDFPSLLPFVLSLANLELPWGPRHPGKGYPVYTRNADGFIGAREVVAPFYVNSHAAHSGPLGFLRREVAQAIAKDGQTRFEETGKSPWNIKRIGSDITSVSFTPTVNKGGRAAREAVLKTLIDGWRDKEMFLEILRGWSNESYPIYNWLPRIANPRLTIDPIAFAIERAALPLFGFPNFGCLMIGYFYSPSDGKLRFWIPRRAETKRTWPGRLDVTVGGGIDATSSPLSTIVRECAEEASLPPSVVESHIMPVGSLPFHNRSPKGWILPGLYYLYELHLPPDLQPKVNEADGEVDNFEVMDPPTVFKALVEGQFKPSSALAILDFLIRHGYITEENEPRYADVCAGLRRKIPTSVPWR